MPELTKPQVLILPSDDGVLTNTQQGILTWYEIVRKMRDDPTIALARDLVKAPMLAAEWSYESNENAPKEAVEWLVETLKPHRHHLLRTTVEGWLDFGWQPYETVIDFEDATTNLRKIKPLMQDFTEIIVDDNGTFEKLKQVRDSTVVIEREAALVTYTNVEGTNWYGYPIMKPVELPYKEWINNQQRMDRYDTRVSGSHWLLRYPTGVTEEYNGETDVDNFVIAQDILKNISNSSKIALPLSVDETLSSLNQQSQKPNAWSLELISDSGSSSSIFMDRFKYWDTLKVRALRLPERSVLEGQFGTKAEAEAHADFAITVMEQRHEEAALLYNWHLVNKLLRYEFGEQAENTVWIKPNPLSDSNRAVLKQVYTSILSSQQGILELDRVDVNAITDRLGIPTTSDEVEELDEEIQPFEPSEGTDD
jgi:hypothetical protein